MVTSFLRIVTPRYLCLLRHVPIVFGNWQSVVFTFFRLRHEGVVVFGSIDILTVADFSKKNCHADEDRSGPIHDDFLYIETIRGYYLKMLFVCLSRSLAS